MGSNRQEQIFCDAEYLSHADLNTLRDIVVQATKNAVSDILIGGVISSDIQPTSPASLTVNVNSLLGYSKNGEHLRITSQQAVDCSGNKPSSGYRWISIFATFAWSYSDYRANGVGIDEYHKRTESVTLTVVNGTATSVPANPGGGAIRLCSIRLHSSTTGITSSMIRTGGDYSDDLETLDGKVNKSGDVLTGSLFYTHNGVKIPLIFGNKGMSAFSIRYPSLGDVGNDNWNNLEVCSTPIIDPKLSGTYFFVDLKLKRSIYLSGSFYDLWITPNIFRQHTTLSDAGQLSEYMFVWYEDSPLGSGNFTGRFQVFALGIKDYIDRLYAKHLRWAAFTAMPHQQLT